MVISNSSLVHLQETLPQLSLTLAGLRDVIAGQRQAVADGDLQAVLALTVEQEELNARMSRLEGHRQLVQTSLEEEFGVRGLDSIAHAAPISDGDRQRLLNDIADLRVTVVELHEEYERCSALLTAAMEIARQTRSYLSRLSGEEPAYGPIRAARARAAERQSTNRVRR